jgi:hypothetical protein
LQRPMRNHPQTDLPELRVVAPVRGPFFTYGNLNLSLSHHPGKPIWEILDACPWKSGRQASRLANISMPSASGGQQKLSSAPGLRCSFGTILLQSLSCVPGGNFELWTTSSVSVSSPARSTEPLTEIQPWHSSSSVVANNGMPPRLRAPAHAAHRCSVGGVPASHLVM